MSYVALFVSDLPKIETRASFNQNDDFFEKNTNFYENVAVEVWNHTVVNSKFAFKCDD